MFQRIDLFVYSGTGNTWRVAQCMEEIAKKSNFVCEIRPIDSHAMPKKYIPQAEHLLGLMAPTLGTIQPLSFFRFILRLPKGKRQHVFLAATGAWTKIGQWYIPGFLGFGLYLAALILLCKGYQVVGIDGFGMPQNWTTLLPPYRESTQRVIDRDLPAATERFIAPLLTGKRVFRRIGDLIVGIPIFPLPILFLLFGHLFLAKTLFAGEGCNGCGACANNCPRGAIRMLGKSNPRPYWTITCEQCMRCAGYCPRQAVECNTFLVLAYAALFSVVPGELLISRLLQSFFPQFHGIWFALLVFLLYYAALVLLAAAVYALFHLLAGIPFLSRIFTRLAFTKLWRKYRHPKVPVAVMTRRNTSLKSDLAQEPNK